MLSEGLVGDRTVSSGATVGARLGTKAETIVNDIGRGRYFETTRFGNSYTTYVQAVTIAATHNSPIAAATATPVIGLVNPIGNTSAAVITRIAFGTTSGTPAGGQVVVNSIPGIGTSITATVTGNIFSNLLSSATSPQGSTMRPYNNVALTGLSPTAGNAVMLVGQATAAAAAGNGGPNITAEDLGGLLIVPPNTLFALMAGTGAGTTWIVNASVSWTEIAWPA